jgi:hypothetical protein
MTKDEREQLLNIHAVLCSTPVAGKQALNNLLGCINALEKLIQEGEANGELHPEQ